MGRWNTWVGVEVDLQGRPEVRRWCRLIGDPNGDLYIFRLWCWLRRFSELGELTPDLVQDAADGVGWPRSGVEFASALEQSGILDARGNVYLYAEVNGFLIGRAERERARKRREYEAKTGKSERRVFAVNSKDEGRTDGRTDGGAEVARSLRGENKKTKQSTGKRPVGEKKTTQGKRARK